MGVPAGPLAILFVAPTRSVGEVAPGSADEVVADVEAVSSGEALAIEVRDDGVLALFPSVTTALRCARRLLRDRATKGTATGVQAAVHVGEPTAVGSRFGGPAVDAVRRLCDVAGGGHVLVSTIVQALAGDSREWRFVPAGRRPVDEPRAFSPVAELVWSDELPSGSTVPLSSELVLRVGLPFRGRTQVLTDLELAWRTARTVGSRLVLVSGESGIGKSRLVAEFARSVHAEGATVLYGRCDEQPLGSYQPFVEALRHYVGAVGGAALVLDLGERAGRLAPLVPELGAVPTSASESDGDADAYRLMLFETVGLVLAHALATRPVLLVLDDLQWADTGTLILLRHLARTTRRPGLLIIGTLRDTALRPGDTLADLLAELRKIEGVDRVALTGLAVEDVRDVLEARFGHSLDRRLEQVARVVTDSTEGNPLFLTEVLRQLVDTGALVQQGERWQFVGGVGSLSVPPAVRVVVGRRVAALSERCHAALRAASTLGLVFRPTVLAAVIGVPIDDLVDLLEEGLRARVISEVAGPTERYAFDHALTRSTLYEELTATRAQRYHLRAAEALTVQGGDPAEVASHLLRAHPTAPKDAVVAGVVRAAEAAIAASAYENAVVLCDRGLGLVAPAVDDPSRVDLLAVRAAATLVLGELDEARKDTIEAADLARRHDLFPAMAAVLARWCRTAPVTGVDHELIERADDALAGLPPSDSEERARLLAGLPHQLVYADLERAEHLALDGYEMARRLGSAEAVLEASVAYIAMADRRPLAERRRDVLAAAEFPPPGVGEPAVRVMARRHTMGLALERGDRAAFDRERSAHEAWARAAQWEQGIWAALRGQAMLALCEGRLDEAERLANEALRHGQFAVASHGVQILAIRREQGRLGDLRDTIAGFAPDYQELTAWKMVLALAEVERGRPEDAARRIIEPMAVDGFADFDRQVATAVSLAVLAEVAVAIGDPALLEPVHNRLSRWAGQNLAVGEFACFGAADRFLGHTALALGRVDEARDAFEKAVAFDDAFGSSLWAAYGRAALATLILDRSSAPAAELLAQAGAVADRSGSVRLRRVMAT